MSEDAQSGKLGLWSGVGLVVANMVGAGVLTSVGYMVTFNGLGPSHVMWAWLVGGIMALLGTRTYAAAARLMPRSGGEYRYLSDLWHPLVGTFAGWSSLLVGFAPPIALNAKGVGAFSEKLGVPVDGRVIGSAMIVLVTVLHMIGLRASRRTQNVLVAVKVALILGFTIAGLAMGEHGWPSWQGKAGAALPVDGFIVSLFFIAFCYSGWNAAIYAADQFTDPRRNVPRAMFIGCALVMVLYLVLNWVFVTNLDPAAFGAWTGGDTQTITLGHVLMAKFVGPVGATIMSCLMIVALTSASSAMTMIGPRVYAAMADDGYLPRAFGNREGQPPLGALILQSVLAIVLVWVAAFYQILEGVGVILTLNAALVALGILRTGVDGKWADRRPGPTAMLSALLFVGVTVVLVVGGIKAGKISSTTFAWVGAVVAFSLVAYFAGVMSRRPA